MSNRFSQSRGNNNPSSNRVPSRVPVSRPVPNRTGSYGDQDNVRSSGLNSREDRQAPPRNVMTPTAHIEEEFTEQETPQKKKGGFLKIAIISVLALSLIGLAVFGVMQLGLNQDSPAVDTNGLVQQGENTNPLLKNAEKGSASPELAEAKAQFDGNPVPVKWPADIKPTRMEVYLDPTSGDPVLLLVGDKAGLGTVLRSYSKDGGLTGFWVIIPDAGEQKAVESTEESSDQ